MNKDKIPKRPTLFLADTDATQAYVLESSKLPEVRGASRLLDALNLKVGDLIEEAGGHLIFAGGGGVLALAEQDAAPNLVQTVEEMYPAKTGIATVSATYRPLPANWQEQKFGDLVSWANHSLRRHKESKTPPPFFERMPFQAVCESCHVRPVDTHFLRGDAPQMLCQPCRVKWENGRKYDETWRDSSWYGRFFQWLEEHPGTKYKVSPAIEIPLTVDEIGRASKTREGYIGLLYLDGDSIGQLLSSLKEIDDYQALSHLLTDTTENVVFQTLAEALSPQKVKASELRAELDNRFGKDEEVVVHPFEIITIGGDDVLLIVPGDVAIPIAQNIGSRFSLQITPQVKHLLPVGQEAITMSAGVVIADDHTPLAMLVELATDLLKKGAKTAGGALDFHVLKSVDMVDKNIGHVRKQYPYYLKNAVKGQRGDLKLLARPYRYDQIEQLWEGLKILKTNKFASSQMQLLAKSLLDGRRQSTLFYHYQHQRHQGDKKAYEALEALLLSLYGDSARDPLPWRVVEGEEYSFQTALWDIAELFDFAPAKEAS